MTKKAFDKIAAGLKSEATDDIVEWLRNSNSDEWCSGQLLKAADEIQRLRTELKESRRLFVRDTDEYIKWTEEAKAEIEKLREALKIVCLGVVAEIENLDWFIMDGAALRVARKAIKDTTDD